MPKKNTGKEFEKLAESIFQKLLSNPDYETIQHDVWVDGIDGKRQVDVLITSDVASIKIMTVIECKDFNLKIPIGKIDEFHSKLSDIKANKGIFISKKGFSTKAEKKAKRLGIDLFTAHEALKDSWSVDFDIPLNIEVVQPTNFKVQYIANMDAGDSITPKGHTEINGINVVQLITKHWAEQSIEYKNVKGLQKILLPEVSPPYYLNLINKDKAKREVENLDVLLAIDFKCYTVPITKIKNTQILNNISEGKFKVFMDIESIFDVSPDFKQIDCNQDKEKAGLNLKLLITPILI